VGYVYLFWKIKEIETKMNGEIEVAERSMRIKFDV
jgi:hypothetical protein